MKYHIFINCHIVKTICPILAKFSAYYSNSKRVKHDDYNLYLPKLLYCTM